MEPTTISKLPDGRFALATDPQRALSEPELREELMATNSRPDIIEDVIYRAKQMR
jgi:SOS response regulatory protein OraA/RecX